MHVLAAAVTDAETGKLKGFGFVTYEEPQGVLLALQALNNLRVDGQELALKANKVCCSASGSPLGCVLHM